MKLLRRLLLAGLVLLALAVGALFLGLDRAVRAAVEKGGTRALGVPTHLERASLSPFDGEVTLGGLEVENPPGFEATPFLTLGRAHTQVDLASLRGEVARIDLVELESVALLLQRREGRSNYGVILEHLDSGGGEEPREPEGEGVRLNIERLVIRDIRADFDLVPIAGDAARTQVTIPELVLEDLGNSAEGASMAEITARVVQALLQASLQAGGRVLSPELLADLRKGLSGLELDEGLLEKVGDIGGDAGKVLEGLGDVLKKKD
jgi:hypothetical protein